MAIYFVDGDNGSDTNNGASVETAWKTIGKACSTLVAGDKVYIKPTTYRITNTIFPTNSGDTTNGYIEYIGDINGEYFGITGTIRITALGTDEQTINQRILFDFENLSYIKMKNLTFESGYTTNTSCALWLYYGKHIIIEDCIFYHTLNSGNSYEQSGIIVAGGRANEDILIDRCAFIGRDQNIQQYSSGVVFNLDSAVTSDFVVRNSIFIGEYKAISPYNNTAPNTKIYNNLFLNCYYVTSGNINIKYFYNNSLIGCYSFSYVPTNYGNNYGFMCSFMTGVTNKPIHINPKLIVKLEGIKNIYQLKDLGNSSYTSDYDVFKNPRILYGGIDVGPIEYNPDPEKETSIVRSGNASLKISKAGYVDKVVWLSSGSHTISVYTKWSGYSGLKPQLIVKQDNYCGISSDQVATATGDGTDWEQLSVNFTLTKDALVTYRLYAPDTNINAVTYFDDDSVS